ncbi:hypothetical protein XBI1_1870140 [Xenorhabdus bovienii str. Intermedium]|uniref:Uncharacterized protein n=1 Tax=Xenorhabdus bovienii str. Intermedium TaxID=1379677 RepID=A0A077QFL6_XENBV|nr:hypothetical protein XBI1_1870140 [Xenorhabdus bovienii str. Intermedium]
MPNYIYSSIAVNIVRGMMMRLNEFLAKLIIPNHHAVQITFTKRQHALVREVNHNFPDVLLFLLEHIDNFIISCSLNVPKIHNGKFMTKLFLPFRQ